MNERPFFFYSTRIAWLLFIHTRVSFLCIYDGFVCFVAVVSSRRKDSSTPRVACDFVANLCEKYILKKKKKKEVGLFTWCSRMELEIHPWSCVCCLTPRHTYYFGCCGSGNVPASDWWFSTWSSDASMCCVPPCWGSRRTGSPGTPESNKETNSFVSFFYYSASFTRILFNDTLIHHFVSVFGGDDLI